MVYTGKDTIKCGGPPPPNDHPLVYLKLDNGSVICPYCGEQYEGMSDDDTLSRRRLSGTLVGEDGIERNTHDHSSRLDRRYY